MVGRSGWRHRAVAVALVVAGAATTAYPVADTLATNHVQADVADKYVRRMAAESPADRATELVRAQRYNQQLDPQLLIDPWGGASPGHTPEHDAYLRQLSRFDAMARLRIPRIRVNLSVYHDATKASLAKGVGHMFGTALPVGGPGTHAVLAAHTGMRYATLFDDLYQLHLGDPFFIDVYGETLTYRVDHISVVPATDVLAVAPTPGRDFVTLLTCRDVRGRRQRLLVRGVRFASATATTALPGLGADWPTTASVVPALRPWMVPRLAGAAGSLALALAILVVPRLTVRPTGDRP